MKIVASWLFRKVGTLKIPLRAHRVTGTEKFWQCFANTEVARRVQANNDGRPITSSKPLERFGEEGRERYCSVQGRREGSVGFSVK